jgi:hypothetical protein
VIQALRLLQEYSSCLASTRLRKPHQLLVLALFKNESHVLAEWVEHYLAEGATAIHLINNNSTDDFLSPLQAFIASGVVTLHHDSRQHCQRQIYNEHLQRLRSQCRWLLVCDLDEFIYARGPGRRISDLLKAQPMNVSCIHLPWKMFGSSGLQRQPKSVRSGFVSRANADAPHPCKTSEGGIPGKTIARASRIRSLDVHTCNLSWGRRILPNGVAAGRGSFQTISEAALDSHPLHLNHYAIQSLELFTAVKMTRGDVNNADYASVRDLDYFRRYDTNAIGDNELAIKSRKAQLP